MKKIKIITIVFLYLFVFACKKQNDSNNEQIKEVKIDVKNDMTKYHELMIEGTMINTFSISNGDLNSCVKELEKELKKSEYHSGQSELKFELRNNFTSNKTDIVLKVVNFKVLLELLCHQYSCEYKVQNNVIVFFRNTD